MQSDDPDSEAKGRGTRPHKNRHDRDNRRGNKRRPVNVVKHNRPAVPAEKLNEQNNMFWKRRRKAMIVLANKPSRVVEYPGFTQRGKRHDDEDDGDSVQSYSQYDGIQVTRKGLNADSIPALKTFDDIHLKCPKTVWSNVQRMKYTQPTPVQKHAIPICFAGKDVMCCAETGSGKTCAFLLPAVSAVIKQRATAKKKDQRGPQKKHRSKRKQKKSNNVAHTAGSSAASSGPKLWVDFPDSSDSGAAAPSSDATDTGSLLLNTASLMKWQQNLGDASSHDFSQAEITSNASTTASTSDTPDNTETFDDDAKQLPKAVYHARAKKTPAPSVLVLAPTRELAQQIAVESQKLCHGTTLRTLCLYGGGKLGGQLNKLAFGCEVLVATPGRLADFLSRGILSLRMVRWAA